MLDFPLIKPWLTYDRWKKEYGDVVYLNLMGQHVVILNSLQSCMDLLDKRSAIYSDRPRTVMVSELMGWDYNLAFLHHNLRWRATRRMFSQFFNEHAVEKYKEAQESHVLTFLTRLLASPGALQEHIRLLFAELIMDVVYGIDVKGLDDKYVKISEEALHGVAIAGNPGTFLVDTIPALKYVPTWFPGASFKKQATEWKIATRGLKDLPFAHVKEELKKGTARPSVMTEMLDRCDDEHVYTEGYGKLDVPMEEVAAAAASAAFAAGSDTTLSSIQMFFLLMAKYPEIQRTAQAELDRVMGTGRFPSLADKDALPYTQAIMKEVTRFHPVLPLGVAHASTEDDIYEGCFIPKGTLIFPNSWSILHNPEVYGPDAQEFNPSRWLTTNAEGMQVINKELPDSDMAAFGFGRRICPGRYFAVNMLFTVTSQVLSCFNISPVSGQPEDLSTEVTDGLLSYPLPYQVKVVPRSADIIRLINDLEKTR